MIHRERWFKNRYIFVLYSLISIAQTLVCLYIMYVWTHNDSISYILHITNQYRHFHSQLHARTLINIFFEERLIKLKLNLQTRHHHYGHSRYPNVLKYVPWKFLLFFTNTFTLKQNVDTGIYIYFYIFKLSLKAHAANFEGYIKCMYS